MSSISQIEYLLNIQKPEKRRDQRREFGGVVSVVDTFENPLLLGKREQTGHIFTDRTERERL
jgi:hypothetical protein